MTLSAGLPSRKASPVKNAGVLTVPVVRELVKDIMLVEMRLILSAL
jgi:hypothetical protein